MTPLKFSEYHQPNLFKLFNTNVFTFKILRFFSKSSDRIDCNDNKLDFDFNTINEKLPPGIRIPSLLQNITLPSFDDFKKVMQEKCTKVSGREAAYEAIEAGTTELKECTSGLMDVDELQNEIKQATIRGELDSVFKE